MVPSSHPTGQNAALQECVDCQGSPKEPAVLDAAGKNHLLSIVLSETLARRRDDPEELVRALRNWRSEFAPSQFDQSSCERMVGQVLRHRLGAEADNIPNELQQEVGEVLWNDPESQTRLERLWEAMGIDP